LKQKNNTIHKCEADNECHFGRCRDNSCICDEGYASTDEKPCSYKQKSKTSAFLLSLTLGNFGADWFFLARENSNYNWTGFFKLFTGVFFVIGSCFMCCAQTCFSALKDGNFGMVFRLVMGGLITLSSLINIIWYFVDWIRILCDSFPDGNGIALKPW